MIIGLSLLISLSRGGLLSGVGCMCAEHFLSCSPCLISQLGILGSCNNCRHPRGKLPAQNRIIICDAAFNTHIFIQPGKEHDNQVYIDKYAFFPPLLEKMKEEEEVEINKKGTGFFPWN